VFLFLFLFLKLDAIIIYPEEMLSKTHRQRGLQNDSKQRKAIRIAI
jgi:hypothetical protein